MHLPIASRVVARVLIALLVFGTLSCLAGSVLAIAANGAGVPVEYLSNSPFSSYMVPGLILGVVVGGTQLAAATALLARRGSALLLSAIAGFGMLIWIFVELAIIGQYSWLQAAYFILGGLELILVLAVLGVIPALVTPLRESDKQLALNAVDTRHDWSPEARRLGIASAIAILALGVLYVATISLWLLVVATPHAPIGDPFLAVMEVLTIMSALALLALVLAIKCFADDRHRVHALATLTLGILATGLTMAVHFVQLTAVRQRWRAGAGADYRLIWPSAQFALEYLAWDLLIGLTLVVASSIFLGTRTSRPAGLALLSSGLLCMAGLVGPLSGFMFLQNIAVVGYAIVLPFAAALVASVFRRTPAHPNLY